MTTSSNAPPARNRDRPRWGAGRAGREDAQEVGHEGRGREERDAHRIETGVARDAGQQRGHDGHGDADTDERDQVKGSVAPQRT